MINIIIIVFFLKCVSLEKAKRKITHRRTGVGNPADFFARGFTIL